MNRKQLILLVVVAAIIGLAGVMYSKRRQAEFQKSSQQLGQKLLKDFPLNDVAQIHIQQGGEVTLSKKGEKWTVKERDDYPANESEIIDLLRKVWDLKVAQPISTEAALLSRFELLAPDKGSNVANAASSGALLEFKDGAGKALASLLLGKKHMKESPASSQFGGGGFPDGRYVMVGGDVKTVSLINDALANVEPKPEQWLNKEWFKIEKLKSISVLTTNATNNWKVSRESETGEWKLSDAKGEEKLDSAKTGAFGYLLSSPAFNDVVINAKPESTGLDKPTVAMLETFDNFNYTLKLRGSGEGDRQVQVAVSANLPKDRAPGKDEKPEDKAKLDKEFAEKNKKLEDKLKAEKAFEKWTYTIAKYTVDQLLKERHELLAEKKEEPKKEEPKKDEPKPAEKSEPK
jgi:hypothetical protein